ncbi:unnamed protein product [Brassica oleracea var. botrytis]|uniref:Uncharacterized protein n=2 Tax=Brassica oleracea TaxID=3712 RepID=A0A0D2ZSZ9_BRAOL|nr:unnamed protein product [Brassica oleracea]
MVYGTMIDDKTVLISESTKEIIPNILFGNNGHENNHIAFKVHISLVIGIQSESTRTGKTERVLGILRLNKLPLSACAAPVWYQSKDETIVNSFRDLAETVYQRDRDRNRGRQPSEDGSTEVEDNPFAKEDHQRNRAGFRNRDRDHDDRGWEIGFKVELPEFHGGVRGEELLDWLVAVQEMLEFKRVPEERKVALVATRFRGQSGLLVASIESI